MRDVTLAAVMKAVRWVTAMGDLRLVAGMAVVMVVGACDWGPRGPGQLRGTVQSEASPVGAIVLQVSGPGIHGFSEQGRTRVFFAETGTDAYRVVLVAADPSRIRFRVDMDDVRSPMVTAVLVEAVDADNAPLLDLSGITVDLTP
jgi:hypothetical protein